MCVARVHVCVRVCVVDSGRTVCASLVCLVRVPDQGSGQGLVLPQTTPHSAVTLNGHCANPLKANPPAAAQRAAGEEGNTRKRKAQKLKKTKDTKKRKACEQLEESKRARQISANRDS